MQLARGERNDRSLEVWPRILSLGNVYQRGCNNCECLPLAQVRDALGAQTSVASDRLTVTVSVSSVSSSARRAVAENSEATANEVAAIDEALLGLERLLRQGAADAVSSQSDCAAQAFHTLCLPTDGEFNFMSPFHLLIQPLPQVSRLAAPLAQEIDRLAASGTTFSSSKTAGATATGAAERREAVLMALDTAAGLAAPSTGYSCEALGAAALVG